MAGKSETPEVPEVETPEAPEPEVPEAGTPEAPEAPESAVFTARSGVLFHDKDVHFTHDRDRDKPGVYSYTAPDAAAAQKVRALADAEPQWGITEVSD